MRRFEEFIYENATTMRLYYSDNFRKLLKDISHGSSEMASRIANILLLSEDSNQMLDKYTLIDTTEKNDMISYVQVNRILKEMPNQDSRVDDDSKFWKNDKIRTKHKIGKWLTHFYKDIYHTTIIPKEIEEFTNVYKATFDGVTGPNFFIAKGDDIKWAYLEENYAGGSGSLANSCMRYKSCQSYFDIYIDNEDVCSLLVLKDDDGKVKGRALMWILDDGSKFLDRSYTANDSDKYLFIEWAKKNGYREYYSDSGTKIVNVGADGYQFYPYMDTFSVFNTDECYITNNDGEHGDEFLELQSQSGGYTQLNGVWSDYHNEYLDEDYAIYIESISDYVHQDDVVYLEYKDVYELENNTRNPVVHSECCETWLYAEDAAYSEILEDYVNVYDGDYIYFIINIDGDTDVVPDDVKYTHLYKEVDDENYSMEYIKNPYTNEYEFIDETEVKEELVEELGTNGWIVNEDLLKLLIDYKPTEELLETIKVSRFYNQILNTYFGFSTAKPTVEEMLPILYMGAATTIDIESTTSYWFPDNCKNKIYNILDLINNEELTNKYKSWLGSVSMVKALFQFVYSFEYTNFSEDIYKRVLYRITN